MSSIAFSSALLNVRHRIDCSVFESPITNSNSMWDWSLVSEHNARVPNGTSSFFAVLLLNSEYFIRRFVTSTGMYASVSGQNDKIIAPMPSIDTVMLLRTNIPTRVTSMKKANTAAVMILFFMLPRIANRRCSPGKVSTDLVVCNVMVNDLCAVTKLCYLSTGVTITFPEESSSGVIPPA